MKSSLCIAALVVTSSVACALAESDDSSSEVLGEMVSSPIVGGTSAASYSEAALVNMNGSICSGAVIAPKVVLTAGHCVDGLASWSIVAPYANPRQTAKGVSTWTEYTQTGQFVNANKVDVAVIVLDRAINLTTYPKLAQSPVASGTKVVNVGRIDDGSASYSNLFVGKQVTVKPGSGWGFPKSYITEEIIQSGDSGGPVYLADGAAQRTIVAVNSGGGGGTQVLARVDLVYAKIAEIIAQTSPTSTPTPPPTTTPPEPTTCSGTKEAEPNDASSTPNALSGTACGELATGADVDWYTWSVASAGVAYEVALSASGDADVLMWKQSGTSWSQIKNTTPTSIAATSSAAGKYLVAVRSAGSSAQSYSLSLAK
jgi:hypothetical protein